MDEIRKADCLDELDRMESNSVHAIVTDPPYGLAFMGRDWDDFEPKEYQEWCEKWARKARDVLKPGGHLLAFSGNRTHHRLFSGVEDAGFEIRDTVTWHYGSGFPKALDVSKAIDKRAGAERKVVATREADDKRSGEYRNEHDDTTKYEYIAPATDSAERWDGFKTALKPATEYVVVARKPLGEDTVAENMVEFGTGALNIEGCRVGTGERTNPPVSVDGDVYGDNTSGENTAETVNGRYPSNVVFDDVEAERLDRKNESRSGSGSPTTNDEIESNGADVHDGYTRPNASMFTDELDDGIRSFGDSGGPSRYFYTSKASKAERTLDGKITNAHPTVKPQDLMEWLVKLATAEGQTVLDLFAGSGTTCKAAKDLNRRFIGIEKQAQWADVARVRCGLTPNDPSMVRDDDGQAGLEAYE
jgi:DNA modification methylase